MRPSISNDEGKSCPANPPPVIYSKTKIFKRLTFLMQIIPVIDLKDNLVVHAIRGDRANYQAIHQHSVLTDSSDIHAVLAGFQKVYPFKTFYIADLNAITGCGDHNEMIHQLAQTHPDIEFWLDDGSQVSAIVGDPPNLTSVIGTESQQSEPSSTSQKFILSLDFKNQQPAGLSAWFSKSQFWPTDVIVMTLNRVGSNSGPDFDKLTELKRSHPNTHFIAAGGVRGKTDLLKLKNMDIQGALLATALHSGAISEQDIKNL